MLERLFIFQVLLKPTNIKNEMHIKNDFYFLNISIKVSQGKISFKNYTKTALEGKS